MAACLDAEQSHSHTDVRTAILAYVLDRIPEARVACLAGSTVHADKAFLVNEMPELIAHLHYRIVDVSSIKELARRWYGEEAMPVKQVGVAHRYVQGRANSYFPSALDDIRGSIAELEHYRTHLFRESL
ncbi:Phosphatidylinositol 3,4,5-trisphosphate-dependent Rac exchanger 2 protein [Malassezia pachydermatis]